MKLFVHTILFYGPVDKLHAIILIFAIGITLSLIRWVFHWPGPLEHFIPRANWFPAFYGHERPSIVSDAVWLGTGLMLFFKTWLSRSVWARGSMHDRAGF